MNTCFLPPKRPKSSRTAILFPADDVAQPYIYSFRCSRGMEACLSRLMRERGLNRTSVIRLALYALDCFSRRKDAKGLSLNELVERLEDMAPGSSMSFREFIRGK